MASAYMSFVMSRNLACASKKFISGTDISKKILDYIIGAKTKISHNLQPHIAVVQVGNDSESNLYIEKKRDMSEKLGFKFTHRKLDKNETQQNILEVINDLDKRDDIHGIIIQLPLPKSINPLDCIFKLSNEKDIEGLNSFHTASLSNGSFENTFVPCTASSCLSFIRYAGWKVEGLKICIIGSGLTAGKPSARLLSACGAIVTTHSLVPHYCHLCTRQSDLIISAVGAPIYIDQNMIKSGVGLINIGAYKSKDNKYCGDVDVDLIIKKLSWITPTPGGVGPVTVAWLFQNLFESYRRSIGLPPRSYSQQFMESLQIPLFS